jgi:hypothetical protein
MLLSLLLFVGIRGQEQINNCGMEGTATRPDLKVANRLKNRYEPPTIFDRSVTLQKLMEAKEGDLDESMGATVTGYVYNVQPGGVEQCNCGTKDVKYKDTHITIVADRKHTEGKYRMIVEVTPRVRAIMAQRGVDWTSKALRTTYLHHTVEIMGSLFYDKEHEPQAFNTNPKNKNDWRHGCAEIHPVWRLRIIK